MAAKSLPFCFLCIFLLTARITSGEQQQPVLKVRHICFSFFLACILWMLSLSDFLWVMIEYTGFWKAGNDVLGVWVLCKALWGHRNFTVVLQWVLTCVYHQRYPKATTLIGFELLYVIQAQAAPPAPPWQFSNGKQLQNVEQQHGEGAQYAVRAWKPLMTTGTHSTVPLAIALILISSHHNKLRLWEKMHGDKLCDNVKVWGCCMCIFT